MLSFLPKKVGKAIEFGCSYGIFSKLVKEKYDCEVWGVDISQDCVNEASIHLDKCLLGDALEVIKELPNDYFDCIIANDFLEHLSDPGLFLERIKPKLKENATITCSIPNVRYFKTYFKYLIMKDWKYEESGVMDKTHLRFFTKKSFIRLLESCDFKVALNRGINPPQSLKYKAFLLAYNILTLGYNIDLKYQQYAFTAELNKLDYKKS